MCECFCMSVIEVGVSFYDRALFSDRITGFFELLTKVIDWFLMVTSCGDL